MNRKIKLALAAILGFSTACSTVKNAPKSDDKPRQEAPEADTTQIRVPPRIVVMYGVRPPADMKRQPLSDKPAEEQPSDQK